MTLSVSSRKHASKMLWNLGSTSSVIAKFAAEQDIRGCPSIRFNIGLTLFPAFIAMKRISLHKVTGQRINRIHVVSVPLHGATSHIWYLISETSVGVVFREVDDLIDAHPIDEVMSPIDSRSPSPNDNIALLGIFSNLRSTASERANLKERVWRKPQVMFYTVCMYLDQEQCRSVLVLGYCPPPGPSCLLCFRQMTSCNASASNWISASRSWSSGSGNCIPRPSGGHITMIFAPPDFALSIAWSKPSSLAISSFITTIRKY